MYIYVKERAFWYPKERLLSVCNIMYAKLYWISLVSFINLHCSTKKWTSAFRKNMYVQPFSTWTFAYYMPTCFYKKIGKGSIKSQVFFCNVHQKTSLPTSRKHWPSHSLKNLYQILEIFNFKKSQPSDFFLHCSKMGPIRPAKENATGVIILVLLSVAATTFAASITVRTFL